MGYHVSPISRGVYGEPSKILEEVFEFLDAVDQGALVMAQVELADLLGAVEGWLEKHVPSVTLADLVAMSNITRRAFVDGTRPTAPAVGPFLPANPVPVDWTLIGRTTAHYAAQGWAQVEVPWIVPNAATRFTWNGPAVRTGGGDLLASAEQGFAALLLAGKRLEGRLMATSPCFRPEPVWDTTHRPWFVKVELFDADDGNPYELAETAKNWFQELAGPGADLRLDPTPAGVDVLLNGIEIGSYGRRTYGSHTWTYGTGLAEPRFSTAQKTQPPSG